MNTEEKLVVTLHDINYMSGYKVAEEERRTNESERQSNEIQRIENEEERIAYYEKIQQRVENGEFDGKPGAQGDTGRGIDSITEYYLATSNVTEITWDGDGTDREKIDGESNYYKVSDLTPTKEELIGQTVAFRIGTPEPFVYNDMDIVITEDAVVEIEDGKIYQVGMGFVLIIKESTTDYPYSPGIYFLGNNLGNEYDEARVTKLTLPLNITTETEGWTTEVQKTDNTNKYLWNYKITTYTDGTTTATEPVIIGVYGDKGEPGETPDLSNYATKDEVNAQIGDINTILATLTEVSE